MDAETEKPNPGSPEAVERGCTCAVMDNARGAGIMGNGERHGWWISAGCLLHASPEDMRSQPSGG